MSSRDDDLHGKHIYIYIAEMMTCMANTYMLYIYIYLYVHVCIYMSAMQVIILARHMHGNVLSSNWQSWIKSTTFVSHIGRDML